MENIKNIFHIKEDTPDKVIPVYAVTLDKCDKFIERSLTKREELYMRNTYIDRKVGSIYIIPRTNGKVKKVFMIVENENDFWSFAILAGKLIHGYYDFRINNKSVHYNALISYGIARIILDKRDSDKKKDNEKKEKIDAKILIFKQKEKQNVMFNTIQIICDMKEQINKSSSDFSPSKFCNIIEDVAKEFKAEFRKIEGEELLKENFPSVYAVGKGSSKNPPIFTYFRWVNGSSDNKKRKKIALVGKGICFDSGGLNLKTDQHMFGMHKDMLGAAHTLALARMIMSRDMNIELIVAIPLAENMLSDKAYRPNDIIQTRNGLTVEVVNTDAEGRILIADALSFVSEQKPDIIFDFASLTGSTVSFLGYGMPAVFSNSVKHVKKLLEYSKKEQDPMCYIPMYDKYRKAISSTCADIKNLSDLKYAGAMTAAMFLEKFVGKNIPWIHFDMHDKDELIKNGDMSGYDAVAIRTISRYLKYFPK